MSHFFFLIINIEIDFVDVFAVDICESLRLFRVNGPLSNFFYTPNHTDFTRFLSYPNRHWGSPVPRTRDVPVGRGLKSLAKAAVFEEAGIPVNALVLF